MQIDNQVLRQNDAIIMKRDQFSKAQNFLTLKFQLMKNQAIENLICYKYFVLDLVPFDLTLDGNFCDESYKYALDVMKLAKSYTLQNKQKSMMAGASQLMLDTADDDPYGFYSGNSIPSQEQIGTNQQTDEFEVVKDALTDIKKKATKQSNESSSGVVQN